MDTEGTLVDLEFHNNDVAGDETSDIISHEDEIQAVSVALMEALLNAGNRLRNPLMCSLCQVDDSTDDMQRLQVYKSQSYLQRHIDSGFHSKQTYFFRTFKEMKNLPSVKCLFGCGRQFKE
jgi:hypothetical protein